MAQLRDAQTSEIIAEGTPVEVALIAETLGVTNVLFDDVGPAFNPATVVQEHKDRVKGLRDANLRDAEQEARAAERNATSKTDPADKALKAARDRVARRRP